MATPNSVEKRGFFVEQVISANYLGALEKCLTQLGVCDFLSHIGFDSERVYDPRAFLSISEIRQVVAAAYELSQCPELGLVFGEQLSIVNHGFLGYAAMSSSTWGAAIEVVTRYLNTRMRLLQAVLHQDTSDTAYLELNSLTTDDLLVRFITEIILVHIIKMRTFLIGSAEPCIKIELNYNEPDYVALYHKVFQTEVKFNANGNRLWIKASDLKQPLHFADDESFQLAKTQLQALSNHLASENNLPTQIKTLLLNHSLNSISMDDVASKLFMSTRTLRRHLQKLEVSYQDLFDEVRLDQAKSLLLDRTLSLTEICFTLGFTDASNFSKAFKRWTGQTPSEYREKQTSFYP